MNVSISEANSLPTGKNAFEIHLPELATRHAQDGGEFRGGSGAGRSLGHGGFVSLAVRLWPANLSATVRPVLHELLWSLTVGYIPLKNQREGCMVMRWICALAFAAPLVLLQGCGGDGSSASAGNVSAVLVDTAEPKAVVAIPSDAAFSTRESAAGSSLDPYITKPLAREGRTVNLGISATTPQSISTELYVGNQMPSFTLGGTFFGDFSLLTFDPLTIRVTDPDRLFSPQALLGFSTVPPAPFANVGLTGNIITTAGTFANKLEIKVCLDYGCKKNFIGSPYVVPYSVRVLRGIELSQDSLTIRSTFGAPNAVGTVVIRPPEGTTVSTLAVSNNGSSILQGTLADAGDGTARLTVRNTSVAPPVSTYYSDLWIWSSAKSRSGFTPPTRHLTLTYIVEPNPALLYLFTPANPLSVLAVQTQVPPAQFRSTYFTVQAAASVHSLTYDGVEMISTPALEAAMPPEARAGLLRVVPAGAPPAGSTYFLSQRAMWSSCGQDASQTLHCLPAGRYPFKVHYTHSAYGYLTPFHTEGELVVGP